MLCVKCNSAGCEEDCVDFYEIYLFDKNDNIVASKEFEFEIGNPPTQQQIHIEIEKLKSEFISGLRVEFTS